MPFNTPEKRKAWEAKNRAHRRTLHRAWLAAHPSYHCNRATATAENYLRQLLSLAKTRRHEVGVDRDYLVALYKRQKGLCAATGIPMTHTRKKGEKFLTNISIDRIDSDKGYVEGNVRLVCTVVNTMKSDMSNSEFLRWCALVAGCKGDRA